MPEKQTRLAIALRMYLAVNEFTHKELANLWGTSEATVSLFLSGHQVPAARTMVNAIAWLLEEHERKA